VLVAKPVQFAGAAGGPVGGQIVELLRGALSGTTRGEYLHLGPFVFPTPGCFLGRQPRLRDFELVALLVEFVPLALDLLFGMKKLLFAGAELFGERLQFADHALLFVAPSLARQGEPFALLRESGSLVGQLRGHAIEIVALAADSVAGRWGGRGNWRGQSIAGQWQRRRGHAEDRLFTLEHFEQFAAVLGSRFQSFGFCSKTSDALFGTPLFVAQGLLAPLELIGLSGQRGFLLAPLPLIPALFCQELMFRFDELRPAFFELLLVSHSVGSDLRSLVLMCDPRAFQCLAIAG